MTLVLVFTDLDGSFLDHHSYDYAPALPAVERLLRNNITIVPTTSKTIDEIEAMDLPFGSPPCIGENGMAISMHGNRQALGFDYAALIAFINELPDNLQSHINGFHGMSIADVMRFTGLEEIAAHHAKNRIGSEPFLWTGDALSFARLEELAQNKSLNITRGGRFYHLMSAGGKEKAMALVAYYILAYHQQTELITIALGDGPNDAAMLASADYGVKIPNMHGVGFTIPNPKNVIIEAKQMGPLGWNDAIHSILDQLRLPA